MEQRNELVCYALRIGNTTEIDTNSHLIIAILFVIVGTVSKVRGHILCLLDEQKEYNHNQDFQRTSC
jgi:hypothetical protein